MQLISSIFFLLNMESTKFSRLCWPNPDTSTWGCRVRYIPRITGMFRVCRLSFDLGSSFVLDCRLTLITSFEITLPEQRR